MHAYMRLSLRRDNKEEKKMIEITGIWTGFQEAHVLESNGIDTLVDARGKIEIRVEGQTIRQTTA